MQTDQYKKIYPGELLLYEVLNSAPRDLRNRHHILRYAQSEFFRRPNTAQFTHAAIYVGDGKVVDSTKSDGVTIRSLQVSAKHFAISRFRPTQKMISGEPWHRRVEYALAAMATEAKKLAAQGIPYPRTYDFLKDFLFTHHAEPALNPNHPLFLDAAKKGVTCSRLYLHLCGIVFERLPPVDKPELERLSPAFLAASPGLRKVDGRIEFP